MPTLIFGDRWSAEDSQRLQDFAWSRALDRQRRLQADHPMVEQFWEIYDLINVRPSNDEFSIEDPEILNHSRDSDFIAVHLQQFAQECARNRTEMISTRELKRLLPQSQRRPFVGQKKVLSKLTGKAVHCWVFRDERAAS
ncbi:hypothetical protein RE428_07640 [Marinobacter nanhaiticus D15-8W]|uniref:hypothetical protein n=1 Tax=Marinobacter nanhaiticus TaxID=1305740 RepID=UPI0029273827|nr:hypothetical protein RE428_07640 [Marinobacter nanhaiticus D15-8W]